MLLIGFRNFKSFLFRTLGWQLPTSKKTRKVHVSGISKAFRFSSLKSTAGRITANSSLEL